MILSFRATALVAGLCLGLGAPRAAAAQAAAGEASAPGAPAPEPEQAPAKGPADLIKRANAPRPGEDAQRAPAASPPSPHSEALLQAPDMADAAPDPGTPAGTVVVSVRDPSGAPVAGADVQLGIMRAGGTRERQAARTDASGATRFEGLDTGQKAAYRVNLVYDGAQVSSTPFRLPEAEGYRVSLTKLPASRDERLVFQMIGLTMVELRDDRLHVTQQARLTNVGREIYVFPQGGMLVELPEGYISPQFQEVMTDQKLVEKPGEGFVIQGSLPPGSVTLAWAYDLELSGDEARVPVDVPFRTYMYRVISDAPEGLSLRVNGMPEAQRVQDKGRSLLVTQVQRSPEAPPLRSVVLHLSGIPGPGPGRWVAVVLACLALVFGALAVLKPGEGDALRRKLIGERREQLLEAVRELDAQKEAGEIGPEYHRERMDALVDELALVLRDEELLEGKPDTKARAPKKHTAAATS